MVGYKFCSFSFMGTNVLNIFQKFYRALLNSLMSSGILLKRVSYGNYWQKYLRADLADQIYINIGAGDFRLPGWHIMDFDTPDYDYDQGLKFKQYDISSSQPLPFQDASVSGIYCSHVIEHFDDQTVQYLFSEMSRVLKPGAVARIVAPDAKLAYSAMKRNDNYFFVWDYWNSASSKYRAFSTLQPVDWPIELKWLHRFATERVVYDTSDSKLNIDLAEVKDMIKKTEYRQLHDALTEPLNYDYRKSSNHINWFDFKKISIMADQAGVQAHASGYLQSLDAHMRVEGHFDKTWPQMSVFVDLVKDV